MKTDIVFPNNNEQQFLGMAEKLNIEKLIFAYKYDKNLDTNNIKEGIKKLSDKTDISLDLALLSTSINLQQSKKICNRTLIDAKEHDSDKIRNLIEKRKPFLVFDLEYQKKDFIHHRNSGLNQVTCRFLKENNIILGFSFSLILKTKNRDFILGRMMQNIRFMRKFKFQVKIASFAQNPYDMRSLDDLKSLFITLGMHPKEAEDSLIL